MIFDLSEFADILNFLLEILKVCLPTAINRADFVSWCMLYIRMKITKCIREKMTRVLSWLIH